MTILENPNPDNPSDRAAMLALFREINPELAASYRSLINDLGPFEAIKAIHNMESFKDSPLKAQQLATIAFRGMLDEIRTDN